MEHDSVALGIASCDMDRSGNTEGVDDAVSVILPLLLIVLLEIEKNDVLELVVPV